MCKKGVEYVLDETSFDSWLRNYGRCWEAGDSTGIRELFAEGAKYYETPFDEPMIGLDAIEQYWKDGAEQAQKEVKFRYASTLVRENTGVARWQASFVRVPSGVLVELDGFLEAEFNENGQCTSFREWWHRRESK